MSATAEDTDIGFGATLAKKTGANAYSALAEVTAITFPELSRDSVEFTHFSSPDRTREFKPGLKDSGDLAITYNLIPGGADDAAIAAHLATDTVDAWRMTFPNGATFDFNGFATKHGRAVPMDKAMTGSATFKLSGVATLTPAA